MNAWALHGGVQDDMFVYDAEGLLSAFLPIGGELNIDLSSQAGHDNLWNAIMAAR